MLPANILAAQGTTTVSVFAPAAAVASGTQFTININVQPDRPIAGAQFSLSFDPALVTVDNVTEGNLLKQSGANTFFAAGKIDNIQGTISGVSGAIVTPGGTVSTPGTLAVVHMTANAEGGSCSLTLSGVMVGDISGVSVPIAASNAVVIINQAPKTVNQPPVLKVIGDKSTRVWSQLNFSISATDADKDKLTYSASNLPAGASFRASTRTFSWRPTSRQVGIFPGVHFEVTDGKDTDVEDITITVTQAVSNKNRNENVIYNSSEMATSSPTASEVFTAAEGSVQADQPQVEVATRGSVSQTAIPPDDESKAAFKLPRFSYSPIVVAPVEAFVGETVSVSTLITNDGTSEGSVEAKLVVNNQIQETQEVSLSAGETREVKFPVTKYEPGLYPIDINGLGATIFFFEPSIEPEEPAVQAQTVEKEFELSLLLEIIGGAMVAIWIIGGIILLCRRRMLNKI